VLELLHEASGQKPGQLFAHGLVLPLVEAPQVLFDWFGTRLDVDHVLGDIPRDPQHFCWAPSKQVLVALEEVDEIAFLFGV
jgi:hypothetical protein